MCTHVLIQGDMLYMPAFWLHTLSTLSDISYQCNTLGGYPSHALDEMIDCGFYDEEQLVDLWKEEARKSVYFKAQRRGVRRSLHALQLEAQQKLVLRTPDKIATSSTGPMPGGGGDRRIKRYVTPLKSTLTPPS